MELIGLGILLVAVAIYYGFFDSAETVSRMANRKVERLEAEQLKTDATYYIEHAISDEDYEKAVTSKAKFKTYRDL